MKKLDTKSISHLFKIRGDQERWQKYDQSSMSAKLFNAIPNFPMVQRLSLFKADLASKSNIKSALDSIGYNYAFDKTVLIKLIDEGAKDSELPIIISCFQFISLLYEEEDNQISTDTFSLFMQVINMCKTNLIRSESNFLFRSLFEMASQSKSFEWNKQNIDLVFNQFYQNENLPNTFYSLFCDFSQIILNTNNQDDHYSMLIDFLVVSFQNKRELFNTDKLFELINFIKPLILQLDSKALFVLGEISKKVSYEVAPKASAEARNSFESMMNQLVSLFEKKTSDQSDEFLLGETERIHEFSDSFSGKETDYQFNFEFINERVFSNSILNLPDKLSIPESFALFKRFSNETNEIIDTFYHFLSNIDYQWLCHFLSRLRKSVLQPDTNNDSKLQSISAFLYLLKQLVESSKGNIDLSFYLPDFLWGSGSNFFFDPQNTAFGPLDIDPLMNDIRWSIIELLSIRVGSNLNPKNYLCLVKLLNNQEKHPFLYAETVLRIMNTVRFDELIDSSNLSSSNLLTSNSSSGDLTIIQKNNLVKDPSSFLVNLLNVVSKTAFEFRRLKVPIESRNAINVIIFKLLENKSSFYTCLTRPEFVNCLLSFVYENGLSQLYLISLYKSLLLLNKDDKTRPLKYFVDMLFQTTEVILGKQNESEEIEDFVLEIKEKIYEIVSFTIRFCPKLSKLYEQFLIPMLQDVSSVKTMDRVIYVLLNYSSRRNFVLDMTIFNLLAEKIEFLRYTNIINLMGSGCSLSIKSMFMIKRPCYIPLLFIMFNNKSGINKNVRIQEDLFDLFKELAVFSEYNQRALHDGKVDSILLSYINNEDPIYVNGFRIHLDYNNKLLKKEALYLLNLIIPAKSSNEIVSHLINIITSPKHEVPGVSDNYDIFSELYKILSTSINHPRPCFDIGNIDPFCCANNIDPNNFKETNFTISFLLKMDPLLINRSTSQNMVVSLFDHSNRRLSIVLMKNGIFASYEANNQNTIVPLIQRINPNKWTFFTFIFVFKRGKPGQPSAYMITSYKNLERQHDAEFCNIKFDLNYELILKLGGYSYNARKKMNYFERCASISNLSITQNVPKTRQDIMDIYLQNANASINYVFNTWNFSQNLTNRVEKMTFLNRDMDVIFTKSKYENTTIETFLPNYCKKLMNSFKTIDKNLFKYITPLISFSLQNLGSSRLINSFKYVLLDEQLTPEKLNFLFYKSLFNIISVLYNAEKVININNITKNLSKKKAKRESVTESYVLTDCWINKIVFNFDIWKKSKDFSKILDYLSSSLTHLYLQEYLSHNTDFFCYFLYHMNEIISENKPENGEIINNFILFLSRLAFIQITKEDCGRLFSLFSRVEDHENLMYYLRFVQNISRPISESGFTGLNDFSTIYSLIQVYSSSEDDNDQIDIVINLILILHEIYGKEFHQKVVKILKAISVSPSSSFIKNLFDQLEANIDEYPNLFSLTTLIAFEYRLVISSGITKIPTKERFIQSELWFVFPSLLALANYSPSMLKYNGGAAEENANIQLSKTLFNFIVDNAFVSNSFESVINFINLSSRENITFNPEIKCNEKGYLIDSPLYYLMHCFINKIFAEDVENKDVIFTIYLSTVISLFFHLDVNLIKSEKDKTNPNPIGFLSKVYQNRVDFDKLFKYHSCINSETNQLENIDLINYALQLALKYEDLFGHIDKSSDKKRQTLLSIGMGLITGDVNKPNKTSFTLQEINKYLNYFKSKSDKNPNAKKIVIPEDFQNMTNAFDWMSNILKLNYEKDFRVTSDLVNLRLFGGISQNYPLYEEIAWVDYVKDNQFKILSNFPSGISENKKIENEAKVSFQLLPILNFCYCPFLGHFSDAKLSSVEQNEELNNFFDGINRHLENQKVHLEPNSYNIIYGKKVPILFRYKPEGLYLNNKFIPFSAFKYIISMNRSPTKGKQSANTDEDLIDNSILFILTNGVSFLLNFVESAINFMQIIKKQQIPSECFVVCSKDDMIEFLKPICDAWQLSIISTFDFLNVLNLMDGRTYLSSLPSDSLQVTNRHYPIFPSIEFLKSFEEHPDQAKQLFVNPEIYYLIEKYPEAYENRKLLEKSLIIHEFITLAFPDFFVNQTSQVVTSAGQGQQNSSIHISARKPFIAQPISHQKIDFLSVLKRELPPTVKLSNKLLFISRVKIQNASTIFSFVFNNGPVIFGQVSFDKNGKMRFNYISTQIHERKKMSNDGKKFISPLHSKFGTMLNYAKLMNFAEHEQGIIFYHIGSLRAITINKLETAPISIQANATSTNPKVPASLPPPRISNAGQIKLHLSEPNQTNASQQNAANSGNESARSFTKLILTENLYCYFEQFLFSQSVFMRNPSTVSTAATLGNIDENTTDLLMPASGVTTLAANKRFQSIAIGCDDGRVIIHAVSPGVRVSTIRTDEKAENAFNRFASIPTKIVITDNCGFVLIYTSTSKLVVASLSGTVISEIERFNTVLSWIAFVPASKQVDFVAFVGSKNGAEKNRFYANNSFLCCFEAAKPEKVFCIAQLPTNCTKYQIQFDKLKNVFIVASYEREIMVFPLPDLDKIEKDQ